MSLLSPFFKIIRIISISFTCSYNQMENFRSSEEHLLETKFVLAWTRSSKFLLEIFRFQILFHKGILVNFKDFKHVTDLIFLM